MDSTTAKAERLALILTFILSKSDLDLLDLAYCGVIPAACSTIADVSKRARPLVKFEDFDPEKFQAELIRRKELFSSLYFNQEQTSRVVRLTDDFSHVSGEPQRIDQVLHVLTLFAWVEPKLDPKELIYYGIPPKESAGLADILKK